MRPERVRRVADTLVVGLFLAALAAPLAAQITGVGDDGPGRESLRRSAFPVVRPTFASLGAFPGRVGAWYDRRFGLRGTLVRWRNRATAALGVSGVDRVLLGKDDWLFLDREASIIEQYRGTRPLDALALVTWRTSLADRRAWLAARGVEYLVVIVPEKHTIYPEHLPDRVTRVREDTPLDQLQEYLARRGPMTLLDLRSALLRAKELGPLLYERTDTHWSSLGAFVAYREIVTALAERHGLRVAPRPLEAFRLVHRQGPGGDLARMLALEDLYRETRVALVPREPRRAREARHTLRVGRGVGVFETGDARLPRALVFHDSFADRLRPFLSEHFERVTYVLQREFSPALVEAERPDVVIHEMAERMLVSTPRDTPPVLGAAGR